MNILHWITHPCIGVADVPCDRGQRLWFTKDDRCGKCTVDYEIELTASKVAMFQKQRAEYVSSRLGRAGLTREAVPDTKRVNCSRCGAEGVVTAGTSPPYYCARGCKKSDDAAVYGDPYNPTIARNSEDFETVRAPRTSIFSGLGGDSGGAGASGSWEEPSKPSGIGGNPLPFASEGERPYVSTPSFDSGSPRASSDYSSGGSSYDSGSSSSSSDSSSSSSSGSTD